MQLLLPISMKNNGNGKEALFYDKLKNNIVKCNLCPHYCTIQENKLGFCKVRKNIKGKLYTLNYAKPISIAVDPIEKKPLYHFNPGKQILSLGTFGCNLACKNCQNYTISREFSQEDALKNSKSNQKGYFKGPKAM